MTDSRSAAALYGALWSAVTDGSAERPELLPVSFRPNTGPVSLASRYAVEETALAAVGVALGAAGALAEARGAACGPAAVDGSEVAAAVTSERWFRVAGEPAGLGFSPWSRFWQAADGAVRTHGNYPWHLAALCRALGVGESAEAVGAAIASLPAVEVEQRVVEAGGVAGAVRSATEWAAHPQGAAVAAEPLVATERVGDAPARSRPAGVLPASGVRVLDLTHIIAGPVGTRFLGALGAEVLRIDRPSLPDQEPGGLGDTLLAKRSAALELSGQSDLDRLGELLARADVVVCGYRPGALERYGLGGHALAERFPGLVAVHLSAFGHTGPWAGRRGFDSVVQAPTGIALGESPDGLSPGALPCQLLDHATGYLVAAAALDGLRRQATEGGSHLRRLSLARTAAFLAATWRPERSGHVSGGTLPLVELGGDPPVTAVPPPGSLGGRPLSWPGRPARYLADEAAFAG